MAVLILDNYDSFTYNLAHYLRELHDQVDVYRSDALQVEDCREYSHILISPGPGLPQKAGISLEVIHRLHRSHPILGVCLGAQALAEYIGSRLYRQPQITHGQRHQIQRSTARSWLLNGLPSLFAAGLYHSWAIDLSGATQDWQAAAHSERGVLMAFEHQTWPLAGVQFHPESIMSEHGHQLLTNWLQRKAQPAALSESI